MSSVNLAFILNSVYPFQANISPTPSYFITIIPPAKDVLDCVHLKKKITQMRLYIKTFSWKFIAVTVNFSIYKDGSRERNSVPFATVFHRSNFYEILDKTFIFNVKMLAIIKTLEQIKDSIVSRYIIFTDSLSFLHGF